MPHISDRLARANFIVSGQRELSSAVTASLFAYGTLMLDPVIEVLIDRVPPYTEATLYGWETIGIAGVIYPGLRPREGRISIGRLYSGLLVAEWVLLDNFENPDYSLEPVQPDATTKPALTYVWRNEASNRQWHAEGLSRSGIADYLKKCQRWRSQYDASLTAQWPRD